jgi:hypothetical protein
MVHIIGSYDRPDELLKDIIFFVGTFGGRDCSEFVSPEMGERAGYIVDCLIPTHLDKVPLSPDQGRCYGLSGLARFIYPVCLTLQGVICPHERHGQSIRAVYKPVAKTAANTQFSPVCRVYAIASGAYYFISAHPQIKPAAYAAITASRLHLTGWVFHLLGDECSYRAALNAFTTGDANRFLEGFITKRADLKVIAAIRHVDSINPYDFSTGPDAYSTLDTLVRIKVKERVAAVNRQVLGNAIHSIEPLFVNPDTVNQRLKAA